MTALKTTPNDLRVDEFIDSVENEQKRSDCKSLLALFQELTGEKAIMWGTSIVGFGKYHYKYDSGREGDWMLAGFSPRKQNLTIYMMGGFKNQEALLSKIGKAKNSVGCLYLKKLSDIDLEVLREMITLSIQTVKTRYADIN